MKLLLALLTLSFGLFATPKVDNTPQKEIFYAEKSVKKSSESEDFLTYWKEDFRKDEQGNLIAICDVSYTSYKTMYEKYLQLTNEERNAVNSTPDYEQGYTIADSIKTLIGMYASTPKQNDRVTLDQKTTIIMVVTVAVFGMSTICVFFVLKNNKIID